MMKRLFALFFLALPLCAMNLLAQAVIKFDQSFHNFGTFPEEKVMTYTFEFTNTGDKPLVIQQAMSSCGCTVANHTKTEVKPGEKGKIVVSYNGKGKSAGHFRKVITIRSNASNGLARIYIEGTMTVKD